MTDTQFYLKKAIELSLELRKAVQESASAEIRLNERALIALFQEAKAVGVNTNELNHQLCEAIS